MVYDQLWATVPDMIHGPSALIIVDSMGISK